MRVVTDSLPAEQRDTVAQGAGDLLIALVGLFLAFWLAHFLYRRKIFLRL